MKEMIHKLMRDTTKAEKSQLPNICSLEWEHSLSSIFVEADTPLGRYGTRSMIALSIKDNEEATFHETYIEKGIQQFLDSGCSNHMSGDRSWFITLDQSHSTTVKLRNNMVMKTAGQGNVKIRLNDVNHIVSDVYYVPELRNNLLSMGKLQERGLEILIKDGLCKIFHPRKGLIIETEMSINKMFIIHVESQVNSSGKEENCLIAKGQDLSQLWHMRLGHLSYIMLKKLGSKGVVQGLPSIENVSDVCKDCLVEAVDWSNYVLNRCPNVALHDITPEEAWSEDGLVDLAWDDEVNNYSSNEGDDVVVATEEEDVVATNDEDPYVRNNTHHGRVNEADTRSKRSVQPHMWMNDYVSGNELGDIKLNLFMVENSNPISDPISYNEVVKRNHWRTAMMDEIKSIEKNNTWSLVELPNGSKTVGVKWIYKTKLNENGELQKYKARLVAKGYSQRYDVDCSEVYAPIARMETVRTIIVLDAQQRWNIYQLDVKSSFLHEKLDEDAYVEKPQGFKVKGSEKKAYKLHKALYGLKQAPRA
nr:retrovirus-related Pol polyprotein from transposon TNT 1-94 [Tanacetum cinerariifolium]